MGFGKNETHWISNQMCQSNRLPTSQLPPSVRELCVCSHSSESPLSTRLSVSVCPLCPLTFGPSDRGAQALSIVARQHRGSKRAGGNDRCRGVFGPHWGISA